MSSQSNSIDTAPNVVAGSLDHFQSNVHHWLTYCFSNDVAYDKAERNYRFLEEALELVQSMGCTKYEALQLVDYVFNRPIGEPKQEVGGVMITLSALCSVSEISMNEEAHKELDRIWIKIDKIREKQASKPKLSPLPGTTKSGITCCYCGQDPGHNPNNENLWNGFLDKDIQLHVCINCKPHHYSEKWKTDKKGLYSEFPVMIK